MLWYPVFFLALVEKCFYIIHIYLLLVKPSKAHRPAKKTIFAP